LAVQVAAFGKCRSIGGIVTGDKPQEAALKRRSTECPAEVTLGVIGGRWKVIILYHLFQGVKRFSELQRAVKGITQKMLTQQLREMERDGLVHREVYAAVPPKVEYSLTPLGHSLGPVVRAMTEWGVKYKEGKFGGEAIEPYLVGEVPKPGKELARRE
jgi:DNA-binding HxlR family transcriptional regulator